MTIIFHCKIGGTKNLKKGQPRLNLTYDIRLLKSQMNLK